MSNKSINKEKILKIITLSLFGVAILLIFIGCFGDIFVEVNTVFGGGFSGTTSRPTSFAWLFSGMWEKFPTYRSGSVPFYTFVLIFAILLFASYIGCLVTVIAVFAIALTKFVKNPEIENIDVSKYSKILAGVIVPFLALIMSYNYYGVNVIESISQSDDIRYGWGPILMIVGVILLIISSALSSVKTNISKKEIVNIILKNISMIIVIFVAIFSFKTIASVTLITGEGAQEYRHGLIFLIFQCYASQQTPSTIVTMIVFIYMLTFAMICLLMFIFDAKKCSQRIIILSSMIAISVIIGALSLTICKQIYRFRQYTYKFGSGPIVGIILPAIALVLNCVSIKFESPKVVNTKQ